MVFDPEQPALSLVRCGRVKARSATVGDASGKRGVDKRMLIRSGCDGRDRKQEGAVPGSTSLLAPLSEWPGREDRKNREVAFNRGLKNWGRLNG